MKDQVVISKKRGRPVGHRLSECTKDKIRLGRLGTHRSKETKDKISKSLIEYFKRRDSLSASMEHEYSYVSEEAVGWIHDNKDAIDNTKYVITEKRFSYLNQVELRLGNEIEHLFGHNTTPEFLLMLKEELLELFGKKKIQELSSLI